MCLFGVWIESLVIFTDGDEARNEVILYYFFFYLLDEGKVVIVDYYVVLVLDVEIVKSADYVHYFILAGFVYTLGGFLQV